MKRSKIIIVSSIVIIIACICVVATIYMGSNHNSASDISVTESTNEIIEESETTNNTASETATSTSEISYDDVLDVFLEARKAYFWYESDDLTWDSNTTLDDISLNYDSFEYLNKIKDLEKSNSDIEPFEEYIEESKGCYYKASYQNITSSKELSKYLNQLFIPMIANEVLQPICDVVAADGDAVYGYPYLYYNGEIYCYGGSGGYYNGLVSEKIVICKTDEQRYDIDWYIKDTGDRYGDQKCSFVYSCANNVWQFSTFSMEKHLYYVNEDLDTPVLFQ